MATAAVRIRFNITHNHGFRNAKAPFLGIVETSGNGRERILCRYGFKASGRRKTHADTCEPHTAPSHAAFRRAKAL